MALNRFDSGIIVIDDEEGNHFERATKVRRVASPKAKPTVSERAPVRPSRALLQPQPSEGLPKPSKALPAACVASSPSMQSGPSEPEPSSCPPPPPVHDGRSRSPSCAPCVSEDDEPFDDGLPWGQDIRKYYSPYSPSWSPSELPPPPSHAQTPLTPPPPPHRPVTSPTPPSHAKTPLTPLTPPPPPPRRPVTPPTPPAWKKNTGPERPYACGVPRDYADDDDVARSRRQLGLTYSPPPPRTRLTSYAPRTPARHSYWPRGCR